MSDVFSKDKLSLIMARVKNKNTRPEIIVRSIIHRMGYRFRTHNREMIGCPDIILKRYKITIFVNGCFWHGHKRCNKSTRPSTNTIFWNQKLDHNISRDKYIHNKLRRLGWHVFTVWECETKNTEKLFFKLARLLNVN
jgi:DNA mismatch endonuclease, patch repair protein